MSLGVEGGKRNRWWANKHVPFYNMALVAKWITRPIFSFERVFVGHLLCKNFCSSSSAQYFSDVFPLCFCPLKGTAYALFFLRRIGQGAPSPGARKKIRRSEKLDVMACGGCKQNPRRNTCTTCFAAKYPRHFLVPRRQLQSGKAEGNEVVILLDLALLLRWVWACPIYVHFIVFLVRTASISHSRCYSKGKYTNVNKTS
ncbi:hypothetical protein SEUBUCD646_0H01160 [Saccharomyces eubayanus]|uniref:Uncharacterized protein n=1 Tax=Saccharomyces eubayanus TaxID=1080349 RepID=A0ABN8VWZ2_SACEU|nr:hypothetical protein SEUBUCD650_0H01170 [Saccharomyces eubayanus]CAI2036625.1 hypothetical protein SEUBUCD646_0H01160 [Saccharomyces eubayanus]